MTLRMSFAYLSVRQCTMTSSHYADLRIMPMSSRSVLVGEGAWQHFVGIIGAA
jgi:hypothetical protein